jgi:hypothetical protein
MKVLMGSPPQLFRVFYSDSSNIPFPTCPAIFQDLLRMAPSYKIRIFKGEFRGAMEIESRFKR